MRYPSKRDMFIAVAVWGTVVVLAVSAVITPPGVMSWATLLAIVASGFVLWIYYGTYYEFREEYLFAKSGPFTERLYYHTIIEATLCVNFYSSMALSKERIFIRTTKKGLLGMTYISPIDRAEFLAELRNRCRNLRA